MRYSTDGVISEDITVFKSATKHIPNTIAAILIVIVFVLFLFSVAGYTQEMKNIEWKVPSGLNKVQLIYLSSTGAIIFDRTINVSEGEKLIMKKIN